MSREEGREENSKGREADRREGKRREGKEREGDRREGKERGGGDKFNTSGGALRGVHDRALYAGMVSEPCSGRNTLQQLLTQVQERITPSPTNTHTPCRLLASWDGYRLFRSSWWGDAVTPRDD